MHNNLRVSCGFVYFLVCGWVYLAPCHFQLQSCSRDGWFMLEVVKIWWLVEEMRSGLGCSTTGVEVLPLSCDWSFRVCPKVTSAESLHPPSSVSKKCMGLTLEELQFRIHIDCHFSLCNEDMYSVILLIFYQCLSTYSGWHFEETKESSSGYLHLVWEDECLLIGPGC